MPAAIRPRRLLRDLLGRLPIVGRRWDRVKRRRWLPEMMLPRSLGAEIGVWRGDFSAQILAVVRPRVLHLIDPWHAATDPELAGVLYDRPQAQMDAIHDRVRERFAPEIATGSVVIHRATSTVAAAALGPDGLDWVYIDGDHTYDGVRADIDCYAAKVGPGGFVCGDDYVVGGRFGSGVKRAVDETVAAGRLTLVAQHDGQFVLRKPSSGTGGSCAGCTHLGHRLSASAPPRAACTADATAGTKPARLRAIEFLFRTIGTGAGRDRQRERCSRAFSSAE